ncbi:transporter [Ottowia pentelensis]
MKKLKPPFHVLPVMATLVGLLAGASAYAEGHYVAGVEGIQAASAPPPGDYYLAYLVHYDIDNFRVPGSDAKLPGSNTGSVTALANRFIKITNVKVFGADYGFEAIVPVIRTSLDIHAVGLRDSGTGIGDVYLGPLVLAWHGIRWDSVAAAGIWLDTASTSSPGAPGKGYKSAMLTGGGTYYFDQEKSVTGSVLFRYERHGRKASGVRPGDQLSMEWGIGKNFGQYSLGVVGYSQWQLGNDSGAQVSQGNSQRHAVGLEVNYPAAAAGVFLKGAFYKEFSVRGGSGAEPAGSLFRVTVVKPF